MTDVPTRWYSRPGIWFWVVITLGAALRFYLVVFTEGTQDVDIWERHARDVREHGLIGYYHGDPSANHPPFVSEVESLFLSAADATGIPFRIFLRAPFALIDAGTTFLPLQFTGSIRCRLFSLLTTATPIQPSLSFWRFASGYCRRTNSSRPQLRS